MHTKGGDTVHVKLDIPKDLHRKLKIIAAETDMTLGEVMLAGLKAYAHNWTVKDERSGWKG